VIEDLETRPERPVVLLGDLNDELEAISTDIAGGLSVPYFSRDDYPDDDRELMRHVASDLALYSTARRHGRKTMRDVLYTFFWDGQHNTLDHVLVSRHFIPEWMREGWGSAAVGDVGSLRVFNDHLMDDMLDELEHWQVSKYHARRSDHGQVVVRLDWGRRPRDGAPD
jgi:predicted extracellular nuclease